MDGRGGCLILAPWGRTGQRTSPMPGFPQCLDASAAVCMEAGSTADFGQVASPCAGQLIGGRNHLDPVTSRQSSCATGARAAASSAREAGTGVEEVHCGMPGGPQPRTTIQMHFVMPQEKPLALFILFSFELCSRTAEQDP